MFKCCWRNKIYLLLSFISCISFADGKEECNFQKNVVLTSPGGMHITTRNASECCQYCIEVSNCTYWSFNWSNTAKNDCWIRTRISFASTRLVDGSTSGVLKRAGDPLPAGYVYAILCAAVCIILPLYLMVSVSFQVSKETIQSQKNLFLYVFFISVSNFVMGTAIIILLLSEFLQLKFTQQIKVCRTTISLTMLSSTLTHILHFLISIEIFVEFLRGPQNRSSQHWLKNCSWYWSGILLAICLCAIVIWDVNDVSQQFPVIGTKMLCWPQYRIFSVANQPSLVTAFFFSIFMLFFVCYQAKCALPYFTKKMLLHKNRFLIIVFLISWFPLLIASTLSYSGNIIETNERGLPLWITILLSITLTSSIGNFVLWIYCFSDLKVRIGLAIGHIISFGSVSNTTSLNLQESKNGPKSFLTHQTLGQPLLSSSHMNDTAGLKSSTKTKNSSEKKKGEQINSI